MKTATRIHLARLSSLASSTVKRFRRDRKGAGAIEFAFIAPLLIVAYLGSFEISVGFNVARKVARASSTVADLLAQQTAVTKTYLDTMKTVATSVMTPYGTTGYTLKITGIKVTGAGTGTVMWSRDQAGATPYKAASATTIPSDLSTVGAFVVRSEMVVPHELMLFAPGLTSSNIRKINISKTYYYRQRVGEEIKCSDC